MSFCANDVFISLSLEQTEKNLKIMRIITSVVYCSAKYFLVEFSFFPSLQTLKIKLFLINTNRNSISNKSEVNIRVKGVKQNKGSQKSCKKQREHKYIADRGLE